MGSEVERREVRKWARIGLPVAQMAVLLRQSEETLRESFKEELADEPIRANAAALEVMHDMALSGKIPAATMFFVKARCGMGEAKGEQDWREEKPPSRPFKLEIVSNSGQPPRLR